MWEFQERPNNFSALLASNFQHQKLEVKCKLSNIRPHLELLISCLGVQREAKHIFMFSAPTFGIESWRQRHKFLSTYKTCEFEAKKLSLASNFQCKKLKVELNFFCSTSPWAPNLHVWELQKLHSLVFRKTWGKFLPKVGGQAKYFMLGLSWSFWTSCWNAPWEVALELCAFESSMRGWTQKEMHSTSNFQS